MDIIVNVIGKIILKKVMEKLNIVMVKNGKMKYKNGEEYNGQFNNGKKEGKEIMIYLNGDICEGNFMNNENGDEYIGQWGKDKKEGNDI